MNKLFKYGSVLLLLVVAVTGCKKLDLFPPRSVTSEQLYTNEAGYIQVLAKVYGSMALTGNAGPAGSGDVAGIDEGTSDFLRLFWKAQELSTDEAVVAWNDPGIQDFHNMNWSANNPMLIGLYSRCFYVITLCNEFIRESTDEKLASRAITGSAADNIRRMALEARFVRSFQYWVLMDLFGNPGFVNEETPIGASAKPLQITRAELFNYITGELKAIEPSMADARSNPYGRADKGAVWALLARIYLNSQVYSGVANWNDAILYSKKVIQAGYTLIPDYKQLMLADNNKNNTEFIWTLNYDGLSTKNFGGTTFLVNASVGGNMDVAFSGLTNWSGIRSTKSLPLLFPDFNGTADKRAQFFQHNIEIENQSEFKDGFGVTKYRNRTQAGGFGKDPDRTFSDIDFPVFRLAEMYLIFAEAVKRSGVDGNLIEATTYFNTLRQRAYGNTNGNISSASLTLDLILDERGRELYWEAFRRTDLIRYNRFTDASYLWPWKGGVKNGTGVATYLRLYPIPATEVGANPNIKQNPNY
ncbi:MAG: RagB/SusD family nutrient uptake outer membrane protein [Chitinophagaceae bacterium]|nr:RagB/SusD family nutrient uptake outer membrane protein [Chitinophagaceae bacterium]